MQKIFFTISNDADDANDRKDDAKSRMFFSKSINQEINEIIETIGRFDGKKISMFLNVYFATMESYGLNTHEMHETFERMVEPPLKERINEVKSLSKDWITFKRAILDEDDGQTSRKRFFDWIANENRSLCVLDPLREFEYQFNKLHLYDRAN